NAGEGEPGTNADFDTSQRADSLLQAEGELEGLVLRYDFIFWRNSVWRGHYCIVPDQLDAYRRGDFEFGDGDFRAVLHVAAGNRARHIRFGSSNQGVHFWLTFQFQVFISRWNWRRIRNQYRLECVSVYLCAIRATACRPYRDFQDAKGLA